MKRLIAAALCLLLAGCAGVPTGSQVVGGKAAREQPQDDPYVRIIPVSPGDWDPSTMVRAFLTAATSFDGPGGDHQVAREYLASGARWQPQGSSIVYDKLDVSGPQRDGDNVTITVQGSKLGRIDVDGQYYAEPGDFTERFRLRQEAKRWRITQAPQELLLSQDDVDRAFRALNMYFFTSDMDRLVPNPIFVPLVTQADLTGRLIRRLIAGPTAWLKSAAVRNAFPPGVQVRRLDVQGGLATVDLSKQARAGDPRNMSIQLVWALRQISEIQQLRLEIDGKPVHVSGASGQDQSVRDDWADYDPDRINGSGSAYLRATDGRLARYEGGKAAQPVSAKRISVYHPAMSYDEHRVAYLNAAGNTLTVADAYTGGVLSTIGAKKPGGHFTTPSWDRHGNVWAAESSDDGSRLWMIKNGSTPATIDNWAESSHPVKALRISRDGTRAAFIVKQGNSSLIKLGRVDAAPSGALQIEGSIQLSSELKGAVDLAWSTSDHLAVVGIISQNPSPLLFDVPVSGAPIQNTDAPGGTVTSITASPAAPLLVSQTTTDGPPAICRLTDRYAGWQCTNTGTDPAYPG